MRSWFATPRQRCCCSMARLLSLKVTTFSHLTDECCTDSSHSHEHHRRKMPLNSQIHTHISQQMVRQHEPGLESRQHPRRRRDRRQLEQRARRRQHIRRREEGFLHLPTTSNFVSFPNRNFRLASTASVSQSHGPTTSPRSPQTGPSIPPGSSASPTSST